ncbi:MAG: RrF2 family transcriptional regulator, partial [Terriglobia bacterium]
WHGLVHSKRGRQGGFWLARNPDQIRLKEVVEIFQGPFESPERVAAQGFPAAWESLYAPTREALEKLSLADLLRFQSTQGLSRPVSTGEPSDSRPRTYFGRGRA